MAERPWPPSAGTLDCRQPDDAPDGIGRDALGWASVIQLAGLPPRRSPVALRGTPAPKKQRAPCGALVFGVETGRSGGAGGGRLVAIGRALDGGRGGLGVGRAGAAGTLGHHLGHRAQRALEIRADRHSGTGTSRYAARSGPRWGFSPPTLTDA